MPNLKERSDVSVPAEGSHPTAYKELSPDIISEAQEEDSRTCINRLTMKDDVKLQKGKVDSLSLHKNPHLMPAIFQIDDGNFIQEFIKFHNKYRIVHNVPPLELCTELSIFSQRWADSIAVRKVMENSNGSFGENIFYKSGFDMDPREPVDFWYKEGAHYPYGSTTFQLQTGHFTQLLWRESREIGVGIARNPATGTYVVANYNPPGNIKGRYHLNVLPPF